MAILDIFKKRSPVEGVKTQVEKFFGDE